MNNPENKETLLQRCRRLHDMAGKYGNDDTLMTFMFLEKALVELEEDVSDEEIIACLCLLIDRRLAD